jgi:predicted MFS family arabinose efflux permease
LCVGGFWAFAVAAGRRLVPDAAGDRATAIVLAGISAGIGLTLAADGVAGIAGTFGAERLTARDVRYSFMAGQYAGASAVLVTLRGPAFGAVPVCLQVWLFRASPEQLEASSAFVVTIFQLALAAGASGAALVSILALIPLAMAGQGGSRQG